MEAEGCSHNLTTLPEVCGSLSRCKDIKQCKKDIQRTAIQFTSIQFTSGNGCRHGEDCAYTHSIDEHAEEGNELREKVCLLEKKVAELNNKSGRKETERLEQIEIVLKSLIRKVLSLESELEDMRVHNRPSEGTEEEVLFTIKERENEDILDDNINVDDNMEAYQNEVDEEKSKLTSFKDLEKKSVVKTKDVLFSTNKTHTKKFD